MFLLPLQRRCCFTNRMIVRMGLRVVFKLGKKVLVIWIVRGIILRIDWMISFESEIVRRVKQKRNLIERGIILGVNRMITPTIDQDTIPIVPGATRLVNQKLDHIEKEATHTIDIEMNLTTTILTEDTIRNIHIFVYHMSFLIRSFSKSLVTRYSMGSMSFIPLHRSFTTEAEEKAVFDFSSLLHYRIVKRCKN